MNTYLEKYHCLEKSAHGLGTSPRVGQRQSVEKRVEKAVSHVDQRISTAAASGAALGPAVHGRGAAGGGRWPLFRLVRGLAIVTGVTGGGGLVGVAHISHVA